MRYDEIIQVAKEQDPGPNPGPDFSTLLTASAVTSGAASKSVLGWLFAGIGAVTVVGAVVFVVGSEPEPNPMPQPASAVAHEVATDPAGPPPVASSAPELPSVVAPIPPSEPEETEPSPAPEAEAEPAVAERPRKPEGREDPEELYRRAEKHLAAGRLGAARSDFRRLVTRFRDDRRHSVALIDLAKLEQRMGKKQSAACRYHDFLDRYPRDMMAGYARNALARLREDPRVDTGRCK